MDRTSQEIAGSIRTGADIDFDSVRRYLAATVDPTAEHTSVQAPMIRGSSVEMRDVRVDVGLSVSDPVFLGTFDETAVTRQITVAINARRFDTADRSSAAEGIPVDLSLREQIAWVRVVLEGWADYGYRVVTDMGQLRVRPAFFIVLVDRGSVPRLAPSDFDWLAASSGGRRAFPEKLVPEDPELLASLRKTGDLLPADMVPHPWAPAPKVWAQQFVSHLTEVLADRLGRMGEDKWFTFDEVSLHGAERVIIRYTWHLVEGDKAYGFDIDLEGVRAQQQKALDDPRARTAAYSIGSLPFDQPVFRSPTVIDGVTWIRFGTSD